MYDCQRYYGDYKGSPIPERIVNEEQKLVTLVFPDGSKIQESDAGKTHIAPDGSDLIYIQQPAGFQQQQQQQRQISQLTQQQELREGESADRKKRLLEQQQRQDKLRNNSDQQEPEQP